jgi:hypothetical protein
MYRVQEIHVIDGGRDHGAPRMPDGGQSASQVDQVHYFPAEYVAECVGVVGEREFGIL